MKSTLLMTLMVSLTGILGCQDMDPTGNMVPSTPSEVRMEAEKGTTFQTDAHGYERKLRASWSGNISRDMKGGYFNASIPF